VAQPAGSIQLRWPLLFVFLFALASTIFWIAFVKLEGGAPEITMEAKSLVLGTSTDLPLALSDAKSGLRRVKISLIQDGREFPLIEKSYPFSSFFRGGETKQDLSTVKIEPKSLGLNDSPARLRVELADYSWRRWGKGNVTTSDFDVEIDTHPPEISVLTTAHNVNQGGVGLTIYRLSEACSWSGVTVGDHEYPGYKADFSDAAVNLCFFALNYDQGRGTEMYLTATDRAGNTTRIGFANLIKVKNFKHDKIDIQDSFLSSKIPEFDIKDPAEANKSLLEKFLYVNGTMRRANDGLVAEKVKNTAPKILWNGTFLRLPGGAPRAGYADHREYMYQGKAVDNQVHLGLDLASLAHSPVPAANDGVVAFTGLLGIYGKTVLLDHGMGVHSMYSHLSSIDVKEAQPVKKGDILGKTGSTGMAGGDHLHLAMLVHDTYVNPIEWWDPKWLKDNVTAKIDAVRGSLPGGSEPVSSENPPAGENS
jgi:murein DD-endopeptidase MepM/ murein hydrolase activator NlpD